VLAAIFAILALVTDAEEIVAEKLPVPAPVTSPVRVMVWSPVLVPEIASNFVLSGALILPEALVVAAAIEIATGFDAITVGVPVRVSGVFAVIVTLFAMVNAVDPVTSPVCVAFVTRTSNFDLSTALILPAALVVAAEIEIAGLFPPDETMGAVPVTAVTVPAPMVVRTVAASASFRMSNAKSVTG
jgi:hypothetical protein